MNGVVQKIEWTGAKMNPEAMGSGGKAVFVLVFPRSGEVSGQEPTTPDGG